MSFSQICSRELILPGDLHGAVVVVVVVVVVVAAVFVRPVDNLQGRHTNHRRRVESIPQEGRRRTRDHTLATPT